MRRTTYTGKYEMHLRRVDCRGMADRFEVTGDPGPAGEDPELLTHKTDVTADIAGKTQYGQSHAIDHQASAQI